MSEPSSDDDPDSTSSAADYITRSFMSPTML